MVQGKSLPSNHPKEEYRMQEKETDLRLHIRETPLCDSHEHMIKEDAYLERNPDILQNLFENYVSGDLHSAGVSEEVLKRLVDPTNPDTASRFRGVEEAWKAIQHTGYAEAIRLTAKHLYRVDEITADTLEAAQEHNEKLVQPGQRIHILRDLANLDHIQTDDGTWPCRPDQSGADFFFYDITWASFCSGRPDLEGLIKETDIDVTSLASLREAMHLLFQKYGSTAIAVKSQHAYNRTLSWKKRTDVEAEKALQAWRTDPENMDEETRLCLGDWCWARGCELCSEHNLPFKIHTGYYAGNDRMPVDYIRAGNMCPLLAEFPETRFVLMHIAYPYSNELVALTKHYRNVYADLCWAWSIDPFSSCDFVRRYLHAAPANKLFVFGGDTTLPAISLGYAWQARNWLTRALQGEVTDGLLTEPQAIILATRLMKDNQYECFQVLSKRKTTTTAVA